jgi:NDP-sugar pyrophosphorylase family protein
MDPAGIRAAVLAGGKGTRLAAAVPGVQKVVAQVAGRPFLGFILDQLETAGVRRAVLCTGHLAEQVEAMLGPAHGAMALGYSREPEPLGTGGALRLALPLLDSDPVLLLNGDSYCAADITKLLEDHADSGAAATLTVAHVDDTARYGSVDFDEETRQVRAFREKAGSSGPGWVNAGIYALSRELVESIPAGVVVSLERDVLPQCAGPRLRAFPVTAPLRDIGTPESFAAAQGEFE